MVQSDTGKPQAIPPSPQLLEDRAVINTVDAPAAALPGEPVQITTIVCCDAPPFTECENVSIKIDDQETGKITALPKGDCRALSTSIDMPNQDLTLAIQAMETDPTGTEVTDTKIVTINAVTNEGEKFWQNLLKSLNDFFKNPFNLAILTAGTLGLILVTREPPRPVVLRPFEERTQETTPEGGQI